MLHFLYLSIFGQLKLVRCSISTVLSQRLELEHLHVFWGFFGFFVTCVKFHVETRSHLEHGYSENMFQMGLFISM
jgi:hypothetical protein